MKILMLKLQYNNFIIEIDLKSFNNFHKILKKKKTHPNFLDTNGLEFSLLTALHTAIIN